MNKRCLAYLVRSARNNTHAYTPLFGSTNAAPKSSADTSQQSDTPSFAIQTYLLNQACTNLRPHTLSTHTCKLEVETAFLVFPGSPLYLSRVFCEIGSRDGALRPAASIISVRRHIHEHINVLLVGIGRKLRQHPDSKRGDEELDTSPSIASRNAK
jgi:hypothetical protein